MPMSPPPRITSSGPAVQIGAKPTPARVAPRVTTTAPQALAKSFGPKYYGKGGKVGSASKRADGIAKQGKTRGKMC